MSNYTEYSSDCFAPLETSATSPMPPVSIPPTSTSTATAPPSGGGGSTAPQQAEIDRLQAQINELTSFLQLYQTGEQQP